MVSPLLDSQAVPVSVYLGPSSFQDAEKWQSAFAEHGLRPYFSLSKQWEDAKRESDPVHWIYINQKLGSVSPLELMPELLRAYEIFLSGSLDLAMLARPTLNNRLERSLTFRAQLWLGARIQDGHVGISFLKREFANASGRLTPHVGFRRRLEWIMFAQENGYRFAEVIDSNTLEGLDTNPGFIASWSGGLRAWGRKQLRHYQNFPSILKLFQKRGLKDRLFLAARWKLTPYLSMARHLPEQGRIYDLACGHGLLSVLLATRRPHAEIVGIDHDRERVKQAQFASHQLPNVRFISDDIRNTRLESCTGISIIDSLHYFSSGEQEQFLKNCYDSLLPRGTLIVREVGGSSGFRGVLNQMYERLATAIKFTKTQGGPLHFRSATEWATLLRNTGFSVSWSRCSSFLFSDILFVAVKPESAISDTSPSWCKRNLVTADDWGMTPAINRAILQLARQGVIRRVSILVDQPYTTHLLDELKSIDTVECGLHFNLTYKTRFSSPGRLLLALFTPFLRHRVVAWSQSELYRQLKLFSELGIKPSHIDGHHHVHVFPGVSAAVAEAAKAGGIPETRIPWDPQLWLSGKFPLYFLSRGAKARFDEKGVFSRPCFYPQLRHFKNADTFAAVLTSRSDVEVIVHPADEDDFDASNCPDMYRARRVSEFQTLRRFESDPNQLAHQSFPDSSHAPAPT